VDPDLLAGLRQVSLLDAGGLDLAGQDGRGLLDVHSDVVRMGDLLERQAQQLVAAGVGDLAEAVVHLQVSAGGRDAGDAHRRLIEHRAVAGLRRLEPHPGLDAGGDELGVEHQAADLARIGAPGRDRPADVVDLAVVMHVGVGRVAELHALPQHAGVDIAPLLRDLGEDLIVQAPDHGGVAGQALIGEVLGRGDEIAHLAVEDGDAQRRLFQRREDAGQPRDLRHPLARLDVARDFRMPPRHESPNRTRTAAAAELNADHGAWVMPPRSASGVGPVWPTQTTCRS
jgi:hypothetical protein